MFFFQGIDNLSDDFCGIDINSPLEGTEPITSIAAQTFPTKVTSVISTSANEHTVVFLGTETGHLKKVIEMQKLKYSDDIHKF